MKEDISIIIYKKNSSTTLFVIIYYYKISKIAKNKINVYAAIEKCRQK